MRSLKREGQAVVPWLGRIGNEWPGCPGHGLLLVVFVVVVTAIVSCSPKQVYIPIADRAALESQRGQEAGADRGARPSLTETEQRGISGREGIAEQDISGRAGGKRENGPFPSGLARDVYFDFDSYALRKPDLALLKELSVWLKANKGAKLTIEGHCDERGSIEYNLALGQKRAEAVREHLLTLGVEKERMKTISYGKELPAVPGHTEAAWAKNRRAHLKIE